MKTMEKFNFALVIATAALVSNLYKAIWLGICGYLFVIGWMLDIWT